MVRFGGGVTDRGGFAWRAAGNSAQPCLPGAYGVAPDAVDRARARFRTPARISVWRYLLGDRVEIHGPTGRSGDAAVPMGAEAGSIFRGGSVAGVRACGRFGRGPRERDRRKARTTPAAGPRCGNGAGGRDRRSGTRRRIWAGHLRG